MLAFVITDANKVIRLANINQVISATDSHLADEAFVANTRDYPRVNLPR